MVQWHAALIKQRFIKGIERVFLCKIYHALEKARNKSSLFLLKRLGCRLLAIKTHSNMHLTHEIRFGVENVIILAEAQCYILKLNLQEKHG